MNPTGNTDAFREMVKSEKDVACTYRKMIYWLLGLAGTAYLLLAGAAGWAYKDVKAETLKAKDSAAVAQQKALKSEYDNKAMMLQMAEIAKALNVPVVVDTTALPVAADTVEVRDST